MKMRIPGLILLIGCLSLKTFSQTSNENTVQLAATNKDSVEKKDEKLIISGMIIARFTHSTDENIDINGKYHSDEQGFSSSSFSLRRARLQAKARLTPRADAALLLNVTDFIGNPSNKVVENAYLKYHFNNYVNVQVGQFRPYFGREDLYPEELLQTLEWSNLYYAFGANGWQSFQAGATVFGTVNILQIPVNYYVGVFNGNGRNQPMDNDNGKLYPARIELSPQPKTKLGLNGGIGKDGNERVWAYNLDIDHIEKLGKRWEVEIQSEYKRGNNKAQFDTSSQRNKIMDDYQLSGFYILPNLKFFVNSSQIRTLEISCRYEKLNCDLKRNGTRKQIIMPVASIQFGKESFLRFETGLIIDRYSTARDKEHNATRVVCQLKAKF